jgi:hypothetical protein
LQHTHFVGLAVKGNKQAAIRQSSGVFEAQATKAAPGFGGRSCHQLMQKGTKRRHLELPFNIGQELALSPA